AARVAEPAPAARRRGEILDDLQFHLHHRHDDELRYALTGLHRVRLTPAIPAAHHELALIVGVDEPHEIAEHDAVFMPEAGARKDDGRQRGIFHVDREPRRDELRPPGLECERLIETRAKVEAG